MQLSRHGLQPCALLSLCGTPATASRRRPVFTAAFLSPHGLQSCADLALRHACVRSPACPSIIAAQLRSHASGSRALLLTSGTPAIALRRHSLFLYCRATRPPRAAAARYRTTGVARATAPRRQFALYCPWLRLTGCSREPMFIVYTRPRPHRGASLFLLPRSSASRAAAVRYLYYVWHALDRTEASSCPLLSRSPAFSQAAALRSFHIRHACDRTAASVLLCIAAQLIPRGLRPCALSLTVLRARDRAPRRQLAFAAAQLSPHELQAVCSVLLYAACPQPQRGFSLPLTMRSAALTGCSRAITDAPFSLRRPPACTQFTSLAF